MVFLSSRISPFTSTVILRDRSPLRDGGRHLGDVAHLAGEVRRHRVDVVGQVLPRAGDARHLRLAAELAFGADFARHAGHFRREGVELVDHRVDRVLELEDLALHVDRDLLARGRRCATAVVTSAMLRTCAVRFDGHGVDVVGQVLPGAGDAAAPGPGRRACPRCRLRAPRG